MQANRVPKNSVTYKLHKQRAYIYITHHHAVEIVYVPHWQQLATHIVFFFMLCYANVFHPIWKECGKIMLKKN